MAFSKVTLNNTTLMDVTQNTVTEDTLGEGMTSLNSAGLEIIGVADIVRVVESVPSVKDTNIIKISGTNYYYAWKIDGIPSSPSSDGVIIPVENKIMAISFLPSYGAIEPYETDHIPGYVDAPSSQWKYENSTNNRTDFYTIEGNTFYLLSLGGVVGTRFRGIMLSNDPSTSASSEGGIVVVSITNPEQYSNVIFFNYSRRYLAVTKDNASTNGLASYLFKLNISKTIT